MFFPAKKNVGGAEVVRVPPNLSDLLRVLFQWARNIMWNQKIIQGQVQAGQPAAVAFARSTCASHQPLPNLFAAEPILSTI